MGPLGPSPPPHLLVGGVQGTPTLGWRPTPTLALQGPPFKDLPWLGGVSCQASGEGLDESWRG